MFGLERWGLSARRAHDREPSITHDPVCDAWIDRQVSLGFRLFGPHSLPLSPHEPSPNAKLVSPDPYLGVRFVLPLHLLPCPSFLIPYFLFYFWLFPLFPLLNISLNSSRVFLAADGRQFEWRRCDDDPHSYDVGLSPPSSSHHAPSI